MEPDSTEQGTPGARYAPAPAARPVPPGAWRPVPHVAAMRPVVLGSVPGISPARPSRPTYREPLPVRPAGVWLGVIAGAVWMALFGLVATNLRGYLWTTLGAGVAAWLVALLLAWRGDRGAAVGVALASGCGLSAAALVLIVRWV